MKTILVTIYHRKNLLYEEGIKKFLDKGYPLYIYETIDQNSFGVFDIVHDNVMLLAAEPGSFDNAMTSLKDFLSRMDWDTVVYLDSDIFFDDIEYAEKLIKQFNESDYGFVSYLENAFEDPYQYDGLIAGVKDQQFAPVDQPPYTFKPIPHYENAFMLIKRKIWNRIPKTSFENTRELVKAVWDTHCKIGIHKREARLTYSHKGNGWFHLGNLTQYYYILDGGELHRLNPVSEVDKARIGFFAYQRKRFGEGIYSSHVNAYLDAAIKMFGGEKEVLDFWNELTK